MHHQDPFSWSIVVLSKGTRACKPADLDNTVVCFCTRPRPQQVEALELDPKAQLTSRARTKLLCIFFQYPPNIRNTGSYRILSFDVHADNKFKD